MENYGANPQFAALQAQLQNVIQGYNQLNAAPGIKSQAVQTISFVKGLDGALTFLKSMAPGSSAAVFDSDNPVFYMLNVDANGVPAPIKLGKFTLEDPPEPESNTVTKKDLEDFKNEIRGLLSQRNNYKHENKNGGNQQ